MITIKVSNSVLGVIKEKISAVEKRAKRIGVACPVSLVILGDAELQDEDGFIIPAKQIQVESQPLKIEGWTLAAALDFESADSMIIRKSPGFSGDLPIFPQENLCEHCGKIRKRNNVYALHNGESFIRVGSKCLKDFLGHADVESMIAFWDGLTELLQSVRDSDGGYSSSDSRCLSLKSFLAHCAAIIRTEGYASQKMVNEGKATVSTASLAVSNIRNYNKYSNCGGINYADFTEVTKQDEDRANVALEWGLTHFDNPANEYEVSMKAILNSVNIGHKAVGFAASLFGAYGRAMESKADTAHSLYIGAEGGKIYTLPIEVTRVIELDSVYGVSYIVVMQNEQNRLCWKTNTWYPNVGEKYLISGTVKAHEEYKGTKQTVLTRCKTEEII